MGSCFHLPCFPEGGFTVEAWRQHSRFIAQTLRNPQEALLKGLGLFEPAALLHYAPPSLRSLLLMARTGKRRSTKLRPITFARSCLPENPLRHIDLEVLAF